MANIYIDESGSMCTEPMDRQNNFFFICLVKVNNPVVAKKRYKRFISKNMNAFKQVDREKKMFINNKFIELKGSALNYDLKEKFARYMCYKNIIEVFLIKVDNNAATSQFFENTARAFNFLLKIALQSYSKKGLITDEIINLHLDNRNVRTNTVYLLEEYLNTELVTGEQIYNKVTAHYYQSENCKFVQIADVFANIHFSSQFNKKYKALLKDLEDSGYIRNSYTFPKKSAKKFENLKKIQKNG